MTRSRPARESERSPLGRRRMLFALARAVLIWERLWPRLWLAVAIATLFVAMALSDSLPSLPAWLHVSILIGFIGLFGLALRDVLRGDYRIGDAETNHRIECDSGLDHRPLTALEDRIAAGSGDPDSETLWQAHLLRVSEAARNLRVWLPSPGMASRDPYGLRAVAVLLLVVAGAGAIGDVLPRLERALVPRFGVTGGGQISLDVWITPPAYTGLAPMFLERPRAENDSLAAVSPVLPPVRIPVGSVLLAQTGKSDSAPSIRLGERVIEFAVIGSSVDPGGYRAETIIEDADRNVTGLSVGIGADPVAHWPVQVIADTPPEVEFTGPPKQTGRAHLFLEFEARDDYAVAGVQVVIRHRDGLTIPNGGDAIRIDLPAPGLGSDQVKGSTIQNLAAHPWAGLEVEVQLHALDARGQAGASDVFPMILPERTFNHPVARAIVEARKELNIPTPVVLDQVIRMLDDLASRPQHFFNDTVVFLALSFARGRLIYDPEMAAVASVQKLLWDTALRLEDGDFSIAERDLREIQERLAAAMREGASGEELERLMDELQQALDKYLSALAEHMEREGLTNAPPGSTPQMVEGGDLQQMIEQARELARTGAMDAARQMLSQLNQMLDNIREGMRMAQPSEEMSQARQLMDGLRGLTQRQQKLLDDSFRRVQEDARNQGPQTPGALQGPGSDQSAREGSERNPNAKPGDGPGPGAGADQEKLRRELGRLMLQMDQLLGSIPAPLGQAERSMRGAADSLKRGDAAGAVPQQTDAVDRLRQAADGLSEQMARRFGQATGMIPGQSGMRPGPGGGDPFGRRPGGAFGASVDDGNVRVPTRMEMLRAREIVDELRRRSGEHTRPKPELNYIERLLRRF